MIIRDNILKGVNGVKLIHSLTDRYCYYDIFVPQLKENQEYTLSFNIKQIVGSGKFSLGIFNKNHSRSAGMYSYNANSKVSLTFTYRAGVSEKLLIYSDIAGQTKGAKAEIKNIKLEEGKEMSEYKPHKEDVKPENQAIFPIGGGITKSTLYRGYKGVSLC